MLDFIELHNLMDERISFALAKIGAIKSTPSNTRIYIIGQDGAFCVQESYDAIKEKIKEIIK